MTTPPCFNSDAEYRAWRSYSGRYPADSFCTDCTSAYQAEMIAAGRCLHPGTQFIEVADEFGDLECVGIREDDMIQYSRACPS